MTDREGNQQEFTFDYTREKEPNNTNTYEPFTTLTEAVYCYHYAGAGACRIHGDAIGCDECEDFQSVVDDDETTEEDDD